MSKHMLIDASHPEETRVAVVDGRSIQELDFEIAGKRQLRGNVYLAKVTRVEPSLQAAFIEYGGNRHGFLAFNEIHPDYFQVPAADREALRREAEQDAAEAEASSDDEDADEALERRRARMLRKYKIQDVLRRRQILLVQVVKEERGNKGAALTTYLSLAGRYCVLMPNTARGGGISRKITQATDRRRLKSAVSALELPQGMGLIIRTAGAARTKAEIARDYDYLLRLWESIRESTLKSIAPALIYAEEDLVKRAVRDMFDKDFESVQVEGYDGYKEARDFMRMLMPSQSAKVHHYTDAVPMFSRFGVEQEIAQIHSPTVPLRSGGYLVINQTEALVAIDVNSGKATRERNIEQTALKTNLEAAEEAARQLRLRDLAGLIVIDFIDMDEGKNDKAVEKVLKDALRDDRARVQMGRISQFGLMEISRQRRRMGVLEGSTHVCEHCHGAGRVRSVESSALGALREAEMEAVRNGPGTVNLAMCTGVGLYVLNDKREFLHRLFDEHGVHVTVVFDDALIPGEHEIERTASRVIGEGRPAARVQAPAFAAEPAGGFADEADDAVETEAVAADAENGERAEAPAARRDRDEEGRSGRGRRRRRRGGADRDDRGDPQAGSDSVARSPDVEGGDAAEDEAGADDGPDAEGGEARFGEADDRGRRRRRGRRGGRRMREEGEGAEPYAWRDGGAPAPAETDAYAWIDPLAARGERTGGAARPDTSRADADRSEPEASTGPAPGPQVAPAAGEDPYGWEVADARAVASAETPSGALPAPADDDEGRSGRSRRPRRRRGGRGGGERFAEADATAADTVVGAEPAMTEAESPDPAHAQAEPIAAAVTPPVPETTDAPFAQSPIEVTEVTDEAAAPTSVEPDPNEITAPPAAPKRGWWSRLRGG